MKGQWMPVLDQAVIALLNGVLQGLLLTVFVWLMLRMFRKINASTRYLIWMGTLGCLAAFPLIHFLLAKAGTGQDVQSAKNEHFVPAQSVKEPEKLNPIESLPYDGLDFVQEDSFGQRGSDDGIIFDQPFYGTESFNDDEVNALVLENSIEKAPVIESEINDISGLNLTSFDTPKTTHQDLETSVNQSKQEEGKHAFFIVVNRFIEAAKNFTISTKLPHWPVLLLLGFFTFGVIWNVLKLTYDLWLLRRLKKEVIIPTPELEEMFRIVSSVKGIRSGIELKIHPKLKTPLAVGFFQPFILMPETLVNNLNDSAKEQILKHELAHLLRYDDWSNLFQRLIQAIYFFHPAVWLVSRRADVEREIACDDHVLDRAGQAKSYALMLTQFANRERDRHLASASAVWNKQSQIKERIEMLLDHHRNTAPRPARLSTGLLTTAALVVAALTLQYGPRVALADDPTDANAAESSTDSNSIFDSVVDEPRSKNDASSESGTAESQVSGLGSSPAIQSFPSASLSSGSVTIKAPKNTKQPNPYQASSGIAAPAEPTAALPQLRPVPGTARVEVVQESHSHPVEVEIMSDHVIDVPHVDPAVKIRTHVTNPLEHRIAKLESLVQTLLKNTVNRQPALSQRARRSSTRSGRIMKTPESEFGHGGVDQFGHHGDDLFGHVPGLDAQLPKPVDPLSSLQKESDRRKLQRVRELEQKRLIAAQTRAEIEKQRAHLEDHMASLKEEMAKLEREMRALEMKAKEQKVRQSFNSKSIDDAFSSKQFEEKFEDAFDAFDDDTPRKVYY